MPPKLESPWKEFLEELDSLLSEPFILHCIGGFAVVAAYGLKRATNDLDYLTLVPCNRILDLENLAGQGSALARKHHVYMQHVGGVASVPEGYEERIVELFAGRFKNIRLFVLDAYDLVISKLSRNAPRDRDDARFLVKTFQLRPDVLRERYEKEYLPIGPPERDANTLRFWIEDFFTN
jgi:hypothetical protein